MFRRHLSPKQAVTLVGFGKLKREYQERQNEILAKLIAIMGDRITKNLNTITGRCSAGDAQVRSPATVPVYVG